MSSELHNKIVYAMRNRIRWLDQHGKEWMYVDLADAVIEALGIVSEEEMDIAADGRPRFYRRYVSEWECSESGSYTENLG